ncbi:hypothetical protein [Streptomyces californicus]|uniref:hypothetical protein n=1 Tax=Streptomyces californicus TaxID=67351 RepID=UPI003796CAB5
MGTGKGGKPDPHGVDVPEPYFRRELLTVPEGKQLDSSAARAAEAGLTCIALELLDGAMCSLREEGAAADGAAIQPRHIDAAFRSNAELRLLWAAWLVENPPAPCTGDPSAQPSAAKSPGGAFDDAIDRLLEAVDPEGTLTISGSAKCVVAKLLAHLVRQLTNAAAELSTRVNSDVIHGEDVRAACRVLTTGELRLLLDREVRAAMAKAPPG